LLIAKLLNCAIRWANADWALPSRIVGFDYLGIDSLGRIDSLECRPNDAMFLNAEMLQSAMIQ
jgi:hypothetical protein